MPVEADALLLEKPDTLLNHLANHRFVERHDGPFHSLATPHRAEPPVALTGAPCVTNRWSPTPTIWNAATVGNARDPNCSMTVFLLLMRASATSWPAAMFS